MSIIRKSLVGIAIAGALAVGLAATPAQAATTGSAADTGIDTPPITPLNCGGLFRYRCPVI